MIFYDSDKTGNVLAALPKSAHPGAKKALAEIWGAEDRRRALDAVKAFQAAYGAKFPKAVAKITDDIDVLLAFYDYPAPHCGYAGLRRTPGTLHPPAQAPCTAHSGLDQPIRRTAATRPVDTNYLS